MSNNATYYKSGILAAAALTLSFLLIAPTAHTEPVSQLMTKEDQIREQMISISKQLGVTCTECHNVKNFTEDTKVNFKVAREHIKIVSLLKAHGFDGKKETEASCTMCHHGKLKPDLSK